MDFEWDGKKELDNIRDHRVLFLDAEHVFDDPLRMVRRDDDSSEDEERWQTIGIYKQVLFVSYTEREDKTRIISARIAEPFERRIYYGNRNTYPQGWHRINP